MLSFPLVIHYQNAKIRIDGCSAFCRNPLCTHVMYYPATCKTGKKRK